MRRIECDKCGKELAATRPEWGATEINLPKKNLSIDLCERCQGRLERWTTERDPVAAAA